MKLLHSATSPFVRKCLVVAHELGLTERLELIPGAPNPVKPDANIVTHNPLGQVPTLVTDEGMSLYDSPVICEYLAAMGGDAPGRVGVLPRGGNERWRILTEQSLADGMAAAAVLARYETALRPENLRWQDWTAGQIGKVRAGLAEIELAAPGFAARVDLGTIAVACALGYLDYRYAALGWRDGCPRAAAWFETFEARPSMRATRPPPA